MIQGTQIPIENFLALLEVSLKKQFTEEQKVFMSKFDRSMISFSSPGTGKTTAAIGGLFTAELYHKIPGKNIYALSFTNMATLEIENRYVDSCKLLHIRPTVNFQTLHSLCTAILKEYKHLISMPNLRIISSPDLESLSMMLLESAEELDVPITKFNVRAIIKAIRALNSSLIFDREHVESKYLFRKTGLNFDDFTKIREVLYRQNKMVETVEVQDILLYTLEMMLEHPEISAAFKDKCKLLLVDEFQDLSLLQLRLISLMSDNVVAIGDIKQQIYAFNGACQEIVAQFYKYFPHADRQDLNQSFRCADEIAAYAKALMSFNDLGGEDFIGIGPGGKAKILRNVSLSEVCEDISTMYVENNKSLPKSILFLFRNNYCAIPIGEELFKRKVPMRINKYTPANCVPIIKELCELCELAVHPEKLNNMFALQYIIPELKFYRPFTESPLYRIAAKEGKTPFEVNYQFRDPESSKAMNMLLDVQQMIKERKSVSEVFNCMWPIFNKNYLQEKEPFLEFSSSYYLSIVAPLTKEKNYYQFLLDETKKMEIIRESEQFRRGVRCYTFHASKGLEADAVYILNADEDVIPNMKQLDAMEKEGCAIEKAREIRNERSLVYVACTRAKQELYISYNNELSSLFSGVNLYKRYDTLYQTYKPVYPDVEAFQDFYKTCM